MAKSIEVTLQRSVGKTARKRQARRKNVIKKKKQDKIKRAMSKEPASPSQVIPSSLPVEPPKRGRGRPPLKIKAKKIKRAAVRSKSEARQRSRSKPRAMKKKTRGANQAKKAICERGVLFKARRGAFADKASRSNNSARASGNNNAMEEENAEETDNTQSSMWSMCVVS